MTHGGKVAALKRLASILLLFCFLGVGTGAAEFLHDLQHAADDAREDAIARSAGQPVQEHHHDETNCQAAPSCTWHSSPAAGCRFSSASACSSRF